jgi:hypothetical protein
VLLKPAASRAAFCRAKSFTGNGDELKQLLQRAEEEVSCRLYECSFDVDRDFAKQLQALAHCSIDSRHSFLVLQNPLPFEGGCGDGIIVKDADAQAPHFRWLGLVAATPNSCVISHLIWLQGAKRLRDEAAAKDSGDAAHHRQRARAHDKSQPREVG